MGAWGTGLTSSDAFADVYADFFDLYNEGKEVSEITKIVTARNSEMLEIPEETHDFWFAIARAQWECKALQPEVLERVKDIIDSGADLRIWAHLGATKPDIEKRRKALSRFLIQLGSERPKAKARKKKIIREPLFKKGECITYRLRNGNFGGALILEAEYGTEHGLNLVAVTRINQEKKPHVEDFRKADVLIKNFKNWDEKPEIIWVFKYKSKEVQEFTEVVGKIEVAKSYLSAGEKNKYAFTSGWEGVLLDSINWQLESEKTKPKPQMTLKVRQLINKGFWHWLWAT